MNPIDRRFNATEFQFANVIRDPRVLVGVGLSIISVGLLSNYPRVLVGVGLSIISVGLVPLFSKSDRNLFHRKVRIVHLDSDSSNSGAISVPNLSIYNVDRLFPMSSKVMPKDVFSEILKNLSANDFVKMARVNKEWNDSIVNRDEYKKMQKLNFISDLKKMSQTIDSLTAIVKAEAQLDLSVANKSALLMEDPLNRSNIQLEISKIDPNHDVTEVKKTAQLIADRYARIQMLIKIAKIDPQHDVAYAKKSAQLIVYADRKDDVLSQIAEIDLLFNGNVNGVTDPHKRAKLLLEIEKRSAEPDFTEIKKTVHLITDLYSKALIQLEITKFEANYVIEAHNTIKTIKGFFKIRSLLELAAAHPQYLGEAKEEILAIVDPEERVRYLLEFATIDPQYSIDEIQKEALSITNLGSRIHLQFAIAKFDPNHDISEVKKTIQMMNNISDYFLISLVQVQALTDIDGAKLNAKTIQDPYQRALSLINIAKYDPLHELNEAEKIVSSLTDFDEIDRGRAAIAKVQAQYGNLRDAKKTIESIMYLRTKSMTIEKVLKFIDRLDVSGSISS